MNYIVTTFLHISKIISLKSDNTLKSYNFNLVHPIYMRAN